ncbi:hypothetical protein VNO78_24576 [Psophocarpus tetragonolobus]|uniref:Uncharacterized protein n=1 Tax=Psophocarpus tetragonolobus TaxID=3891 RepID=A0AAN9S8A9_PSOTE
MGKAIDRDGCVVEAKQERWSLCIGGRGEIVEVTEVEQEQDRDGRVAEAKKGDNHVMEAVGDSLCAMLHKQKREMVLSRRTYMARAMSSVQGTLFSLV